MKIKITMKNIKTVFKNSTSKLLSWNNYYFYLEEYAIINDKTISVSIDNFWSQKVSKAPADTHLIVLFRIQSSDRIIRTLGTLKVYNINDESKQEFKNYVQNVLALKMDAYEDFELSEVIFSYGIKTGLVNDKLTPNLPRRSITQNYRHYKLPITMIPEEYGKILKFIESENLYIVKVTNDTTFFITRKDDKNFVEVYRKGDLVLTYEDSIFNENGVIERIIGDNKYHYSPDGTLLFFQQNKKVNFIKPKKIDKEYDTKFVTMDIETYESDIEGGSTLNPYLISYCSPPFGHKSDKGYLTPAALIICL